MSTKKRVAKPTKGKGIRPRKKVRKEPYIDKTALLRHKDDRSLTDEIEQADFEYDFARAPTEDDEHILHKNGTIYETRKVRAKLGLVPPTEEVPPLAAVDVKKTEHVSIEEIPVVPAHSIEELIQSAEQGGALGVAELFMMIKAQQSELAMMRENVVQIALLMDGGIKGEPARHGHNGGGGYPIAETSSEEEEEEEGGGFYGKRAKGESVHQCIGRCGRILPSSAYGRTTKSYLKKDGSYGKSSTRRKKCKNCSRGG